MELWLDSIDLSLISRAKKMGMLYGVTTNPSILANSRQIEATIQSLLSLQDGPITIQLTATKAEDMINQAIALKGISDRIFIKIPVSEEGLIAIHALSAKGIEIMATVIYSYRQFLLAAQAGASYAAPYFSSMEKEGIHASSEIERMCNIKERYQLKTKILAASLQNLDQLDTCLQLGVDAVTLKDAIFLKFIEDHPATMKRVESFLKTWKENQEKLLENTYTQTY